MKFRLLGVIALLSILWSPLAYGHQDDTASSSQFAGEFSRCTPGRENKSVLLDEKTVRLPKIIARPGAINEFLAQDEMDVTFRLWVCLYGDGVGKEYGVFTRHTPTQPGHFMSLFYDALLIQGAVVDLIEVTWAPIEEYDPAPSFYGWVERCDDTGSKNYCRENPQKGRIDLSRPFTIKLVCHLEWQEEDEEDAANGLPRVCTAGPEISVNIGGTPPDNGGTPPPDNGDNPYTGIACTVTGAWFDPEQNGSGFNLINTPSGYVMYFYGYKGGVNGEPLWLLSDVGPTDLSVGESFELTMYSGFVGNDGSFSTKPTGDRSGLKKWGTAKISFTSDATGVITLSGKDGTITHNIQRLTAVQGLDCSGVAPTENRFSLTGTWYDPAYTGSGFNVIGTTSGFVMYFYGYKGNANGKTLWLLSDVGDKNIVKGKTYTLPVYSGYSGNGGSFTQKPTAGNSGVKEWGKATFTFNSCNQGVITLAGNDGTITHNVQRLTNIAALQCSE